MLSSPDIARLKTADQETYRKLVCEYGDRVFNTALGMLQNRENAEDVTQEVFIEVFRSVGSFREESAFSTWIYRITLQKSLALIRSNRTAKRFGILVSLLAPDERHNFEADSPFYHPGVQLENKELSAILFQAIARLPLNQRTAFTLHKVEGLSHQEIATVMETTVSAVESLIVRARKRLRELLSDYYEKNER